jgi:hypothetical protein
MNVAIQFTSEEEAKALPILLSHSPGTVRSSRTYVVEDSVVEVLHDAGILFVEIAPPASENIGRA